MTLPPAPALSETKPPSPPAPSTITLESPLPDPIITTTRLIIRPIHPQDAPSMQRAASPPSITKYMTLAFAYPYTIDHAKAWINMSPAYYQGQSYLTPPLNNFAICPISAPEVNIGGIGLKPGSDVQSHTAEIGYWIGEDYWGQGLISEALEAMTEWAFTVREGPDGKRLARLWAGVFDANKGSMKCLEKCGYRAEGVMKGHIEKHGQVADMHIYGLTRADWDEWKRNKAG